MRLGVIACGAPLASRAADLVQQARSAGWEVTLTLTPAAAQWASNAGAQPVSREVDALVVCPLTFNTANKWALGISDTALLGVLSELLGSNVPMVAVPMVNETLWRHPAWADTLARLRDGGVALLDPVTGEPQARPVAHGSGSAVAAAFDPTWVLELLG